MAQAMSNLPEVFRAGAAGLGTLGTYLFGMWDPILQALIVLVVIDYVTGVLSAYFAKELNSEIGFKGIAKKVCIFLMVALATILDASAGLGDPWLRTAVIMFFIANESISALENMGKMGVPLPEFLKAALEKLHRVHTAEKIENKP